MNEPGTTGDAQEREQLVAGGDVGAPEVAAWEQIEAGRFMPRRVRGSFRGGKLG